MCSINANLGQPRRSSAGPAFPRKGPTPDALSCYLCRVVRIPAAAEYIAFYKAALFYLCAATFPSGKARSPCATSPGGRYPSAPISFKTPFLVGINHSYRLEIGINNGGPHEFHAPFLQIFGNSIRQER